MPVSLHARPTTRTGGSCRLCGYDMAGLPIDAACPECGAVMTTSRRARLANENITLASPRYLWRLAFAATTLLVAAAALIGSAIFFHSSFLDQRWLIGLAASFLWALAVWPVTSPRVESDGNLSRARRSGRVPRWVARLTQPAWFLVVLSLIAHAKIQFATIAAGAPPGPELAWILAAAWTLGAIALIGLGFLGGEIASIVRWAGDEELAERLRAATIGIVVLPPILLACYAGGIGAIFLTGLALIIALLLLLSISILVYGVVQLALMSLWAVHNAATAQARDARVAQRAAEEAKKFRDRVDRIHGSPIASSRKPGPRS